MSENDKPKPYVVPGLPGADTHPNRAERQLLFATRVSAPNVSHPPEKIEAAADATLEQIKLAQQPNAPLPDIAVTEMRAGDVTATRYDVAATLAGLRMRYQSQDPKHKLFALWNYVALVTELATTAPDLPVAVVNDMRILGMSAAHLLEDMENRLPNPLIAYARHSGTGRGRIAPGQIEQVRRFLGLACEHRNTITDRFEPLNKPDIQDASRAVVAELHTLASELSLDLSLLFNVTWSGGTPEATRRRTKPRTGPIHRVIEWRNTVLNSLSPFEAAELHRVKIGTEADARAALKLRMAQTIETLAHVSAKVPALEMRRNKRSGNRQK